MLDSAHVLVQVLIYRRLRIGRGRGPRVVVSTAAFHARARGSAPGLGGLKETKMFLQHPRVKLRSLCHREVAFLASDRQVSNFESCVWRTVSSHSSHHHFGLVEVDISTILNPTIYRNLYENTGLVIRKKGTIVILEYLKVAFLTIA